MRSASEHNPDHIWATKLGDYTLFQITSLGFLKKILVVVASIHLPTVGKALVLSG
jgi:hypothetical protein